MTQTQEFVAPPPNHGCEECLKPPSRENEMVVHYSGQHGGRWLCSRCFFTLRPDWPTPGKEKMDPWIDDDTTFKKRWEGGEKFTKIIAERLRGDGLDVVEPERSFREEFKDRFKYRDEVDLIVNGLRVEVKSRKPRWTTLDDFPLDGIFVDTTQKWDGHEETPVATINVCKSTGAIIVVRGNTRPKWTTTVRRDRTSGHESEFYVAPRETWTTYESLVEILKEEDVETKKKLEMLMLAEKVMKYIEGNVNDPARIKNAIARYREKRNEK